LKMAIAPPSNETMAMVYASDLINLEDKRGMTALHWAAMWGNTRAVDSLIRLKADIFWQDNQGLTPWDVALKFHGKMSMCFTYLNHVLKCMAGKSIGKIGKTLLF